MPKQLIATCIFLCACNLSGAQGKLFIIGGGDRTNSVMQAMQNAATMKDKDYAVVLPMSSAEPDSSFYYFKTDYDSFFTQPLVMLNFTKENVHNASMLDSLKKAKLVYITGGDQDRFMNVVLQTPVYDAIHSAYTNGATIAGSSAGAAVMSEKMITGNQLTDTEYHATFPKLISNNLEVKTGLGLLTEAVIDQHFIVRSRYNRLLSALQMFPSLLAIGIDESTVIIVTGHKVIVAGDAQVIVMKKPENMATTKTGLVKFSDIEFSVYTAGDTFYLH